MKAISDRMAWYGDERTSPVRHSLQAGPLSMTYESGALRHIRLNGVEVLRGIYVAVRSSEWATIPMELIEERITNEPHAFHVRFLARHRSKGVDFRWTADITGHLSGAVLFSMDGQCLSEFESNRIGFCVLHPVKGCAGMPCTVLHADERVEEAGFPLEISPHQPLRNLAALTTQPVAGVKAHVLFSGDVFEMEDQRNWTDHSFKTYCTPLEKQLPQKRKTGERVHQSIFLHLEGTIPYHEVREPELSVSINPLGADSPRVVLMDRGFRHVPDKHVSKEALRRLAAVKPAHIRCDLDLNEPRHLQHLQQAAELARAIGSGLELAPHFGEHAVAKAGQLTAFIRKQEFPLKRVLLFVTELTGETLSAVMFTFRGLDCKIVLTADTNYTELNRMRPEPDIADGLGYALNPQVHAFDHQTLVENLEMQGQTVAGAHRFSKGKPIHLSSVSMWPWDRRAPDPRHRSLFGAGWHLGSLHRLGCQGVSSATFCSTFGEAGLMEDWVHPLYHVFCDVGEMDGAVLVPLEISHPWDIEAIVLRLGARHRLLVASFAEEPRRFLLRGVQAQARARNLDATNLARALADAEGYRADLGEPVSLTMAGTTLDLPPMGLLKLDWAG